VSRGTAEQPGGKPGGEVDAPIGKPSLSPLPVTRPPRIPLPEGACDCHAHVIGPAASYPTRTGHFYLPVEASPASYEAVLRTLGFSRAVLVQPSCYGDDNRCLLQALRQFPLDCRAVAVTPPDVAVSTLVDLDAAGVRGVRANIVGGGLGLDDVRKAARRIADFGWHTEIYATGDVLAAVADALSDLPSPLVVDHLGHCHPEGGIEQPGFQRVLRLLEGGRTWVKLSAMFRVSARSFPHEDLRPFVDKLCEVAPERLVWGTDWPHAAFWGRMPDTTDLLDLLLDWLGEGPIADAVLRDNPARLYGFDNAA